MAYKIEVSAEKTYIILTVTGDLTNEQAMQQNIEAHALGKSLGISRFFVDMVESRFVGSTLNHYEFVNKDMNESDVINRYARVVALVHPDDHSHDFMETVSKNNGHDLTLFRDREAAIHYLIQDL
ncbi:MAG: hypothetical protein JEZ00_10400 [Anaerolineaceae bacterium]|nr:hypothetical protein [Anaerolineaceae bacterium]